MKRLASAILTITLLAPPVVFGGQQSAGAPRSREYWFAYAGKLPIGSTVRVRTMDGRRQTAILALVDAEGITLEPKARIPETPRRISFDDLQQLELQQNGVSIAKAIAIGAGIGAGTFVGLLMILAATAFD